MQRNASSSSRKHGKSNKTCSSKTKHKLEDVDNSNVEKKIPRNDEKSEKNPIDGSSGSGQPDADGKLVEKDNESCTSSKKAQLADLSEEFQFPKDDSNNTESGDSKESDESELNQQSVPSNNITEEKHTENVHPNSSNLITPQDGTSQSDITTAATSSQSSLEQIIQSSKQNDELVDEKLNETDGSSSYKANDKDQNVDPASSTDLNQNQDFKPNSPPKEAQRVDSSEESQFPKDDSNNIESGDSKESDESELNQQSVPSNSITEEKHTENVHPNSSNLITHQDGTSQSDITTAATSSQSSPEQIIQSSKQNDESVPEKPNEIEESSSNKANDEDQNAHLAYSENLNENVSELKSNAKEETESDDKTSAQKENNFSNDDEIQQPVSSQSTSVKGEQNTGDEFDLMKNQQNVSQNENLNASPSTSDPHYELRTNDNQGSSNNEQVPENSAPENKANDVFEDKDEKIVTSQGNEAANAAESNPQIIITKPDDESPRHEQDDEKAGHSREPDDLRQVPVIVDQRVTLESDVVEELPGVANKSGNDKRDENESDQIAEQDDASASSSEKSEHMEERDDRGNTEDENLPSNDERLENNPDQVGQQIDDSFPPMQPEHIEEGDQGNEVVENLQPIEHDENEGAPPPPFDDPNLCDTDVPKKVCGTFVKFCLRKMFIILLYTVIYLDVKDCMISMYTRFYPHQFNQEIMPYDIIRNFGLISDTNLNLLRRTLHNTVLNEWCFHNKPVHQRLFQFSTVNVDFCDDPENKDFRLTKICPYFRMADIMPKMLRDHQLLPLFEQDLRVMYEYVFKRPIGYPGMYDIVVEGDYVVYNNFTVLASCTNIPILGVNSFASFFIYYIALFGTYCTMLALEMLVALFICAWYRQPLPPSNEQNCQLILTLFDRLYYCAEKFHNIVGSFFLRKMISFVQHVNYFAYLLFVLFIVRLVYVRRNNIYTCLEDDDCILDHSDYF